MIAVAIAACIGSVEHLSSTQQEAVTFNALVFDLGDTQLGNTSGSQTIVISPQSGSGNSDDQVTQVLLSNCGDFIVSTGPLPADIFRHCASGSGTGSEISPTKRRWSDDEQIEGRAGSTQTACADFVVQTMNVPVAFRPTVQGIQTCTVTFVGSFGSQGVTLKGNGIPPPFQISVRPSGPLAFGDVKATTTVALPVEITNIGSDILTITSITLNNGNGQYTTTAPAGTATVQVGEKLTFDVACTPPGIQGNSVAGALAINSNATNGGTITMPLSCRGIDTDLTKTPPQVAMAIRVGEDLPFQFQIKNDGNQTATIDDLSLAAAGFNVTLVDDTTGLPVVLPFNLGQNQTRDFRFNYTSTAAELGAGTLTINHDGNKNDVVPLTFEALETAFGASEPDNIQFPAICVGDTASLPVKVFSTKDAGFKVTALTTPTSPFVWEGGLGEVQGSHADELTYTARVTPTIAGPQTSMVTLTTDIPGDTTQTFTLGVDVFANGANALPPVTDYGVIEVGKISLKKFVTLTNCSAGSLMVTGTRIEGDAAVDFGVVGPDLSTPRVLAKGENLEIEVVMAPQELPGQRQAVLVIEHSQGETTAQLDGTALGEPPTVPEVPGGPETYYECNSGGSGSLFVGFVVAGLLRRRRHL